MRFGMSFWVFLLRITAYRLGTSRCALLVMGKLMFVLLESLIEMALLLIAPIIIMVLMSLLPNTIEGTMPGGLISIESAG
jgi:hypothetical protein